MKKIRLSPIDYPLKEGESWWVVHPNTSRCEFKVPSGAVTVCTDSFLDFTQSTVYTILGDDPHNGWITLGCSTGVMEMPYYIFARHFDAQAFIRGVATPDELDGAVPFDYRPTLPKKANPQLSFEYHDFITDHTGEPLGFATTGEGRK